VYCGKTAEWIRMPFGIVSGVSRMMGVSCIRWGGDRRRGRGSFGSEFGASHCNQWGLCWIVLQELHALLKLLWGLVIINIRVWCLLLQCCSGTSAVAWVVRCRQKTHQHATVSSQSNVPAAPAALVLPVSNVVSHEAHACDCVNSGTVVNPLMHRVAKMVT